MSFCLFLCLIIIIGVFLCIFDFVSFFLLLLWNLSTCLYLAAGSNYWANTCCPQTPFCSKWTQSLMNKLFLFFGFVHTLLHICTNILSTHVLPQTSFCWILNQSPMVGFIFIFVSYFLNRLCLYCTCTFILQHSHADAPDTFLLKIKSIPDEIGCVLSLMERLIPMNISHADSISIFDCLVDSVDLQCILCHLWDERFWTICKHGEVLGEMRNRVVTFSKSTLHRCC